MEVDAAGAALVLVAVGLLSRWFGLLAGRILSERFWWGANLLVWIPRLAAVIVVSEWLVQGTAAADPKWEMLRYELAASMFAIWIALDSVARADFGAEVAAYLGLAFFATSVVLIHAAYANTSWTLRSSSALPCSALPPRPGLERPIRAGPFPQELYSCLD